MPSIKKPPPEEAEAARPPSLKKHPSVDSSGGRPSSIKKPTPAEDAAATRAALEHQDRVKKMAEERYLFEQRALTLCTGMIVLIAVLWTVALSTDHWYELDPPQGGLYLRGSKTVLRDGHTGLWRMCTDQFHPPNLTAYLSITTAGPEVTSKRPRAQPCKMMKLRGQKRKRCRQELKRRFKSALAAKRRASLSRIDAVTASPVTTPTPDAVGDGNATNGTDSEWLGAQFDDAVSADTVAAPDPVDEEVNLEAVSPEEEVFFEKAEEEIRERVFDGEDENQTINETLTEVVQQVAKEFTEVSFYECNPRELSEYGLEPASVEWQMLSYMRTLLTFSVVSLLLLLLGFLSALYTFKEPRYTFKRLSAGIQFIACCGLVVVIQVFRSAVEYERWQELGGVDMAVGYSQVLAWLSLCMQFVSSFLFLLYSRKRKRNKAPNEEIGMADEPTIIGR